MVHLAAASNGLDRGRHFFRNLLKFTRGGSRLLATAAAVAGTVMALVPAAAALGAPSDPLANACSTQASVSAILYPVKSGDSLYGIAQNLGITGSGQDGWIARVVSLNNLKDPDSLVAGQSISLPPVAPPDAAKSSSSYTVKSGDTLSAIADKLGLGSVDANCWIGKVVSLNQLSSADSLAAGQLLSLPPTPGVTANSSAPTAPSTPTTDPAAGAQTVALPRKSGLVYTVAPGDTLYGIAIKLGVPSSEQDGWVAAAANLSQLTDPDHLTVGQTLTVPPLPAGASVLSAIGPTTPAASTAGAGNQVPPPVAATNAVAVPPSITPGGPPGLLTTAGATPAVNTALGPSPIYLQGGSFYTLKPGDTLKAIAQKLGVPPEKQDFWIAEVAAINGISPTALPIGDGIRIP